MASQRDGGETLRLHSQGDQDLCTVTGTEHLIFKTSAEEQTVDLPNKDMTKDSQRFLRWFHRSWRTVSPQRLFSSHSVGLVKSDFRGSLLDTTLIDVMWAKQAP